MLLNIMMSGEKDKGRMSPYVPYYILNIIGYTFTFSIDLTSWYTIIGYTFTFSIDLTSWLHHYWLYLHFQHRSHFLVTPLSATPSLSA
ncbi:MAG: hypothetical protein H6Q26_520 [Bacteroidetes bacterium]|nr:hypothetical protein [Bacteroidota bacterium]